MARTSSHDTTFPEPSSSIVLDVPPAFPPEGVFSTVEEAISSLPNEPVDISMADAATPQEPPMADAAMLSEDDNDDHPMVPELVKQTLSLRDHAHLWRECLHEPHNKCLVN